uniref:Uncharacterized protein n=1 Tax=Haemonchus contortus TaxID=6289 RepID=A0A7I4XYG8_HAECO
MTIEETSSKRSFPPLSGRFNKIDGHRQTDKNRYGQTADRWIDRQKQTCTGQVDKWTIGQTHTGGRERTAHTGGYGQTDADRTGHGRTCSDGGGRARTKGRTRSDVDKHRQGRGMHRHGLTNYTDRHGLNTHLWWPLTSVLLQLHPKRPGPQSPLWI